VLLRALDAAQVLVAPGVAAKLAALRAAQRRGRGLGLEQLRGVVGVADEHLRDPARVVEAHEQLGDDEAALRQLRPVGGELHRRLEASDCVVA
jgi:hypothetical protein